jgi:hypothetical protein
MENPFVVLVEAIRAFDALGIDYVVVGSIASSIHGEYRAWYRLGQEISELQWRDVTGIIGARRGQLDQDYLRLWAERLGLTDLLHRALAESV